MDVEVRNLINAMDKGTHQKTNKGRRTYHAGQLDGHDIVIVKSGVGKVNATECTTVLIHCFGVSTMINAGVAGALSSSLHVGDVIVANEHVQSDVDVSALGYEVGHVPGEPSSVRTQPWGASYRHQHGKGHSR